MDPVVRIVPFIVALEVNLLLSRQAGSLKKHAPVGTFETYPSIHVGVSNCVLVRLVDLREPSLLLLERLLVGRTPVGKGVTDNLNDRV